MPSPHLNHQVRQWCGVQNGQKVNTGLYKKNAYNTLRPRQNGRHFADDTFHRIFVNENVRISIKYSLKFVPMGPINNILALVQIMAWCRSGDKPLSEPMMASLLTHIRICVTRPQWVNEQWIKFLNMEWRKPGNPQNFWRPFWIACLSYFQNPNTRVPGKGGSRIWS